MKALVDWFDNRTGIRAIVHSALYEHIPGGARWRYVWGSTLVFAFATQAVTGMFLWMAYSPSSNSAWESVYYIQHEMFLGWLLRGVHHFMAQAMIVLLALHLMQVVIDGAYRAPREVNFWLGLILMQIVLGLSLTGYLLPWDQKGYWATRVATNIAGVVPVVGPVIQRVVVGGAEYGHHTLTRFFALHAGVLPATLVGFLMLHLAIFRRHGIHAPNPKRRPDVTFWPDQVLRDAVACLAVLAVVLFLVCMPYLSGDVGANALSELGADLGPPADGSQNYDARPEWYFLFLFQFLKFFKGHTGELIGAVIVPGLAMVVLFAMPIIGRWKFGHRFNVGFLACMLIGAGLLTAQAIYEDRYAQWWPDAPAPGPALDRYNRSKGFLDAVAKAEADGHRAIVLARQGVDARGVLAAMRDDPLSQGPGLFRQHCAACHSFTRDGEEILAEQPSAPNLGRFASREWIAGLLDSKKIVSPDYFGLSPHKEGDMVAYVTDTLLDLNSDQIESIVFALSAQAGLKSQKEVDIRDAEKIAAGIELIKNEEHCAMCHKFGDAGSLGMAPDLTGYGSREWIIGMISNPNQERYYQHAMDNDPKKNKQPMPAFAATPDPKVNLLNEEQLGLLVDWLRHEWFEEAAAQ